MLKRREIIEHAKKEVMNFRKKHYNLFFIVKRKKKKVIALLREGGWANGDIIKRTSSNCLPHDTFNEFIGKAIAVRRLFDLEVPQMYLNVPNPDEFKAGDIIQIKGKNLSAYAPHSLRLKSIIFESGYIRGRTSSLNDEDKKELKIIDDTGYIEELEHDYKGPEDTPFLDCYDRQKNDCDGRCHGMADCPIVDYIKGERQDKPTKKEMLIHIKKGKKDAREWRKFLKENPINLDHILKKHEDK